MKQIISAAVLLLLGSANAEAQKCRVLALSGGGQSAVFQAGALQGLLESAKNGELEYDFITGVSGGAINGAILSDYAKGDEAKSIDRMKEFWLGTANEAMYEDWLGGLLEGLLVEGGLYNDAKLRDYIKKEFKDISVKREFDLGLTNLLSGRYDSYTNKDLSSEVPLDEAL